MNNAWGKWGPEDEAGALNHIGDKQIIRAASLVKTGLVVSLAQALSSSVMMPRHRPNVMHFMSRDGGDYAAGMRRAEGFQFAEDTVVMPLHVGTHIDALCHCWYDDTLYNGYSANEVTSKGARRLGVENMAPIFTRGLLLDFVALTGSVVPDGTEITLDMVEAALRRIDTSVQPGDAVLLRTGWLESQSGHENFDAEPGLGLSAARFLVDRGVAMVGADNFAIEVMPFPSATVFPVHQLLIRDYGVPLLEGMVLKGLAEAGAGAFLFCAAALPIRGATGSPIHPIAVI